MHFCYNNKWQVLTETNGAGQPTAIYSYLPDYVDAVAVRMTSQHHPAGEGEHFYTCDALYNVTSMIERDSKQVVERYRYAPYGAPTIVDPDFSGDDNGASDIVNEHLYTGRRTDPGSGLQLNRYRYYHALLGRWVNRDPIDYAAGDMNVYAYVNGMPTHSIDPSGLAGGWRGAGHDVLIEDAMDNADTDPNSTRLSRQRPS